MRRIGFCVLMMSLLTALCACGGAGTEEKIAAVQETYQNLASCTAEAEVACAIGEETRRYTLSCVWENGGVSTVTVLAPEALAGITAQLAEKTLALTYDGAALEAGAPPGSVCAANCLPLTLEALAQGYVLEYGEETWEEQDCARVSIDTAAPDGEKVTCDVWLDAALKPVRSEIAKNGQVISFIEFTNVEFGDTMQDIP